MQRRAIHSGYNDDAKVVLRGQGAEDGSLDAGDNHEASGHEDAVTAVQGVGGVCDVRPTGAVHVHQGLWCREVAT